MTTILVLKTKDAIFIGADSQVSEGFSPTPENYRKIVKVNNNLLLGSCGSLGFIQHNLREAIKTIQIQKILSHSKELGIDINDLALELSERNFYMPMEYKKYESSSFLLIGISDEIFKAFSVSADGAVLEVNTFYVDGSGSLSARPILQTGFHKNITKEEGFALIITALRASSSIDLFTNRNYNIGMFVEYKGSFFLKEQAIEDDGKKSIIKLSEDFFMGNMKNKKAKVEEKDEKEFSNQI